MNEPGTHRDRTTRGTWLTLHHRRWAYGLAVALASAGVVYGVLTIEQSAALVVVASALLGVSGLALANPTREG
jgi:hypothetical protein